MACLFLASRFARKCARPAAPSAPRKFREFQQWVDAAGLLGASHIRVFAGHLPGGATEEQGIAWGVATLKPACEYAAKRGATPGLAHHGGLPARAATTWDSLW